MITRLDVHLTKNGNALSRARAQSLIRDGGVTVNGQVMRKPSFGLVGDEQITITASPPLWVSRAALKLVHILDLMPLDLRGSVALDIGASTGGFTEVLLSRGAVKVFAIDVGHGQMHPRIADDVRVKSLEKTNARDLNAATFTDPIWPEFDVIVTDVSFISLTLALPPALTIAKINTRLFALVKPQFELDRAAIGKGGIVKTRALQDIACAKIVSFLNGQNWQVENIAESPILGSDGNLEFVLAAVKRGENDQNPL